MTYYEDTFKFTLRLLVTSQREHSGSTHSALVKKIRLAFQQARASTLNSTMTLHAISDLSMAGSNYTHVPEENLDQTALQWEGVVCIRPTAWAGRTSTDDLEALYDIEPEIEAAAKAHLTALSLSAFLARDTSLTVCPRVDVLADLGESNRHLHVVA